MMPPACQVSPWSVDTADAMAWISPLPSCGGVLSCLSTMCTYTARLPSRLNTTDGSPCARLSGAAAGSGMGLLRKVLPPLVATQTLALLGMGPNTPVRDLPSRGATVVVVGAFWLQAF